MQIFLDCARNARNADLFYLVSRMIFGDFVVDRVFYYFPFFLDYSPGHFIMWIGRKWLRNKNKKLSCKKKVD